MRRAFAFLMLFSLTLGHLGCDTPPPIDTSDGTAPTLGKTSPTDKPSPAGNISPVEKLSPAEKGPARVYDKTFDDVKFDIEPDAPFDQTMLTKEINSLVGKRIRIRGYILPTFQRRGIKQFVLVRDNLECCFGPGAALFDCILVDMKPGTSASFSVRPVAVVGEFSLQEVLGPEGNHLAIFHLTGESVD
jgi:hypothetical protein